MVSLFGGRPLIARDAERHTLVDALQSDQPELVAVYGRRRVGKTFLVRAVCGPVLAFELVGIHDADLPTQLRAFSASLEKATNAVAPLEPPADWHQAFRQLASFLVERAKRRRGAPVAIFFDEVPWLASRRSGFLAAFEHFWNTWAGQQPWLTVVLCGSAASWMLEHVVTQRGGLHNRVTRRLRVEPFTLAAAEALLVHRGVRLDRHQTIELYLALGGVPHYLSQVERGESAAQSIDRLCFARDGLLREEFDTLFSSLFDGAERHEAVVRLLAKRRRGMTRAEVLKGAKLDSGGGASKVLEELEQSGFIAQTPRLGRTVREGVYWLADEFSLFSLSWIARGRRATGDGSWVRRRGTPAWRAWAGLAFEALCLKHIKALKQGLGIAAVESLEASWSARSGPGQKDGAQIDLVIDRADRCVNLCEMKFSEAPFVIDKAYARELRQKRDAFRAGTGTRKAIFLTLVTSAGLIENEYSRELVAQSVMIDALFAK